MNRLQTTKLFEHACSNCVYVLSTHGDQDYDWYVCPQGQYTTSVIARYGDEGSHYWSMPACNTRSGVLPHDRADAPAHPPGVPHRDRTAPGRAVPSGQVHPLL